MEKIVMHWQLNGQPQITGTERYCHNCGRKVLFQDSGKRRHNANGKNIYAYAIFKCENGHTWNQILNIQKAAETVRSMKEETGLKISPMYQLNDSKHQTENSINTAELKKDGIRTAEIILDQVSGRWRLDKALSRQIPNLSRTQLEKQIRDGTIRLDGETAKPGSLLKPLQIITINLT